MQTAYPSPERLEAKGYANPINHGAALMQTQGEWAQFQNSLYTGAQPTTDYPPSSLSYYPQQSVSHCHQNLPGAPLTSFDRDGWAHLSTTPAAPAGLPHRTPYPMFLARNDFRTFSAPGRIVGEVGTTFDRHIAPIPVYNNGRAYLNQFPALPAVLADRMTYSNGPASPAPTFSAPATPLLISPHACQNDSSISGDYFDLSRIATAFNNQTLVPPVSFPPLPVDDASLPAQYNSPPGGKFYMETGLPGSVEGSPHNVMPSFLETTSTSSTSWSDHGETSPVPPIVQVTSAPPKVNKATADSKTGQRSKRTKRPSSKNDLAKDIAQIAITVEQASSTTQQHLKPTRSRRLTVEEDIICLQCCEPIGRLFRRGTEAQIAVSYRLLFHCMRCHQADGRDGSLAYDNQPKKKRQRADEAEQRAAVSCDVCHKSMCTGAIDITDPDESDVFVAEYVCSSCHSRYQRCTDCGAGGGRRLGAGKWRATEMFNKDRRTCKLSHTRNGPADAIENGVHRLCDMDGDARRHLAEQCAEITRQTVLSNFAVPEVMEAQPTVASSFNIVIGMAESGAAKVIANICRSEDTITNFQYLGLRSSLPKSRKGRSNPDSAQNGGSEGDQKKELTGFVLAEYDILAGLAYIKILAPWGSGDAYDTNLGLLEHIYDRMRKDREEISRQLALDKSSDNFNRLPELKYAWTVLPLPKGNRLQGYMERKRSFIPLDTFLSAHPEVSPKHFPPFRDVQMSEEELRGFQASAQFSDLCHVCSIT